MIHNRKWQIISSAGRIIGTVLAATYDDAVSYARARFGRKAIVVG